MLSACRTRTHTAAQKLKTSSSHVPPILPENDLCKCSHADKPLLRQTQAMRTFHN